MLAEFDPSVAPELNDALCPYVGLDAFLEANHHLFFGRQRLVRELIDRVAQHRLVAVVGPSGSGKSSLVRAGLVPALKDGALPGSQDWRYTPPIVPGSDPLASLARLFHRSAVEPIAHWNARLRASCTIRATWPVWSGRQPMCPWS